MRMYLERHTPRSLARQEVLRGKVYMSFQYTVNSTKLSYFPENYFKHGLDAARLLGLVNTLLFACLIFSPFYLRFRYNFPTLNPPFRSAPKLNSDATT
jgi:hypothetical protein